MRISKLLLFRYFLTQLLQANKKYLSHDYDISVSGIFRNVYLHAAQTFFTLAHLELFVPELAELPPGCFKVPPAAAGVISKAGGQHSSSAGGTTQVWKLEEKKET